MAQKLEWTVQGLLPEAVIAPVMDVVAAEAPGRWPVSISTFAQDSNDRAEVRFDDGRTLVVKRARYEWARGRFAVSRAAAGLLREAGIPAPQPLAVTVPGDGLPIEVYWKVELPTLGEVWTGAGPSEREVLLREWGRLIGRIHRIRLPRHGPLLRPHPRGLGGYLQDDLEKRLLPAVGCTWPEARPVVEALAGAAERIAGRVADAPAVLVHNDLHSANVLCSADGAGCVGVLDLEAAFAGPPEADIAHAEVLHGPLFGKPLPAGWMDELLRGYRRTLDPAVLAYFRAFHLANLGYHAALCGYAEHAADIRSAVEDEVRALRHVTAPSASRGVGAGNRLVDQPQGGDTHGARGPKCPIRYARRPDLLRIGRVSGGKGCGSVANAEPSLRMKNRSRDGWSGPKATGASSPRP